MKKLLFSLMISPFLLQPAIANTDALMGAMLDDALSDPEVQKELNDRWNQVSSILQDYQNRVVAQDRAIFELAKTWTKLNPNTPKNAMELLAQCGRLFYANRTNPNAVELSNSAEAGVGSLFNEYTPVVPTVDTNLTVANTFKEAVFLPRSNYKNLTKLDNPSISDNFEIWAAYPNTVDLLSPDYVKKITIL